MPKRYPPHKCENPSCNNVTVRKRYCSKECQRQMNFGRSVEHVELVCIHCGKKFSMRKSYYLAAYVRKGIDRLFCSKECRFKHESENGRVNNTSHTGTKSIVCKNCGKEFEVKPSEFKRGKKYCSLECRSEYINKNQRITKICKICNKEFKTVVSRPSRFCSQECYGVWLSDAIKGENHPNWNNGSSFEPYCEKFNNDFKERCRAFFNYECVECGKSQEENGRKLSVHHVNYDKLTCCNDATPLFVVLCHSCHAKTNGDRQYWEEHFTEIIFERYNGKCYIPKTIEDVPVTIMQTS